MNDASILAQISVTSLSHFCLAEVSCERTKTSARRRHENHPKTRPSNVMSFILEDRWPLDGFDQRELRRLSKTAKRNGVGVADVIYEAVESFVAKCEAEADLEEKVIKFPTVAKRW